MKVINNHPQLLLGMNLVALIAAVVLLSNLYLTIGLSAIWLLLLLLTLLLLVSIFSLFKRQNKQLTQVIRALANGDNTLGFGTQHPMREHFDEVKQQMQTARFNAEQQSDFLNALLVHVNLAVMVCDDKGTVIESNPAVARLLGKSIGHLNELNDIGKLILTTQKSLKSTVQWLNGEQQDTLTLQVSIAEIQGQERKIVTLQSIHELLLNKEQQAYKRLTQVLTHEVANTITPLASIAQTCQGLVPQGLSFDDEENKQDLQLALTTLATRTEYLGEFIASFRQISSLPLPNLIATQISAILERIHVLYLQQLATDNIKLDIQVESQYLVMLDSGQIEQVLINLVKNAIEAVRLSALQQTEQSLDKSHDGTIALVLGQNSSQQLYVDVVDSGPGVADHVIDMIFVPFYTTKQQGSGIGLSLSRQIMVNHGGDLLYIKRSNGSCFRCLFG